jgi:hypothetical protein
MADDGLASDASGGGMTIPWSATAMVLSARKLKHKDTKTFPCNKCGCQFPVEEMSHRNNTCEKDAQSYKSLTDRWKTNKNLRSWWVNKTPDEKRNWYLQQPETSTGMKRQFDSAVYQERSALSAHVQEDEVDCFIPYRVFFRESKAEGKEKDAIDEEWKAWIETRQSECKRRRNEWLIPQFEGIQTISGTRHAQEVHAIRQAEITSPDQLVQMMNSGEKMLNQFSSQIPVPVMPIACTPNVEPQYPVPTDTPLGVQAPDVIGYAIALEVTGRCS